VCVGSIRYSPTVYKYCILFPNLDEEPIRIDLASRRRTLPLLLVKMFRFFLSRKNLAFKEKTKKKERRKIFWTLVYCPGWLSPITTTLLEKEKKEKSRALFVHLAAPWREEKLFFSLLCFLFLTFPIPHTLCGRDIIISIQIFRLYTTPFKNKKYNIKIRKKEKNWKDPKHSRRCTGVNFDYPCIVILTVFHFARRKLEGSNKKKKKNEKKVWIF
jgi:hypothetical protein